MRKEKEAKDAEAESMKENAESIPFLVNEIEDLKNEILLKDAEINRFEIERLILKNLYDKGIIDGEGNVLQWSFVFIL